MRPASSEVAANSTFWLLRNSSRTPRISAFEFSGGWLGRCPWVGGSVRLRTTFSDRRVGHPPAQANAWARRSATCLFELDHVLETEFLQLRSLDFRTGHRLRLRRKRRMDSGATGERSLVGLAFRYGLSTTQPDPVHARAHVSGGVTNPSAACPVDTLDSAAASTSRRARSRGGWSGRSRRSGVQAAISSGRARPCRPAVGGKCCIRSPMTKA